MFSLSASTHALLGLVASNAASLSCSHTHILHPPTQLGGIPYGGPLSRRTQQQSHLHRCTSLIKTPTQWHKLNYGSDILWHQ